MAQAVFTAADIEWAKEAFTVNVESYAKARRYYAGQHELSLSSDKFQSAFGQLLKPFAYNRCRPVVDAVANKLHIKGFNAKAIDLSQLALTDMAGGRDFGQQAMTLWRLANMSVREGELYVEAATTGDAYAVVWYDDPPPVGTGLPRIYPNRAELMRVRYDDNGRIVFAAKQWLLADGPLKNHRRLTLYTPTQIIKLVTKGTAEGEMPKELEQWEPYKEVNALGQPVTWPIDHTLGRPPVLHYANNAPMLGDYGISDLKDVIPLQDALNKTIADTLVAMEFNAYQQRYAIGIEAPETDPETGKALAPFRHGPGELWWTTEQGAHFGAFPEATLEQFLKVKQDFDLDIARVSHTPIHWLVMNGGEPPSGESLKTASEPFTDKLKDRQASWGSNHAEAMQLKFKLLGVSELMLIEPEWEEAAPRSERERAEIGKMMADAGVPLPIAARVMGLSEQDLAELEALEEEKAASREQAMAQISGLAMQQRLARPPAEEEEEEEQPAA